VRGHASLGAPGRGSPRTSATATRKFRIDTAKLARVPRALAERAGTLGRQCNWGATMG
jgi:hypothetical protein